MATTEIKYTQSDIDSLSKIVDDVKSKKSYLEKQLENVQRDQNQTQHLFNILNQKLLDTKEGLDKIYDLFGLKSIDEIKTYVGDLIDQVMIKNEENREKLGALEKIYTVAAGQSSKSPSPKIIADYMKRELERYQRIEKEYLDQTQKLLRTKTKLDGERTTIGQYEEMLGLLGQQLEAVENYMNNMIDKMDLLATTSDTVESVNLSTDVQKEIEIIQSTEEYLNDKRVVTPNPRIAEFFSRQKQFDENILSGSTLSAIFDNLEQYVINQHTLLFLRKHQTIIAPDQMLELINIDPSPKTLKLLTETITQFVPVIV
jgi:hypothetical protein